MSFAETTSVGSTLPASWYRENAFYDLERRAIFSKQWLLISHSHRLPKPGNYARYQMAGYPFFIMKDRAGNISTFMNICRHRAFPLIHEDSGTARIISCKYHGWSYGINGNLAKAPRFDSVSDFDKSEYSLFKVHTHIDKLGFIWINLDASGSPIPWEKDFDGVDTQDRLKEFKLDDYRFDHTWTMEGDFNWKALVENYNECYHCPTAHPGFAAFLKPEGEFPKAFKKSYIEYYVEGSMREDVEVLPAAPTYIFPNATLTISQPFFYMMSAIPTSPTTTLMHYEIYRNNNATEEEYNEAVEFFKQVEREDKALGNGSQSNLNTDTYVAGPLHPKMEDAVLHFHTLLRKRLREHREDEVRAAKSIWPARRISQRSSQLDEDQAFCEDICGAAALEAGALPQDQMAW